MSTRHSPIVRWYCIPHDHVTTTSGHPFCFVHHGVRRNGRDYRIIAWIRSTKRVSWPSQSSSPRRRSLNIYGTISAICTIRRARPTRGKNGHSASSKGCSNCCLRKASRPGNATGCSATPRADSSCTEWCRSVSANVWLSLSVPMQAPTQCRIFRRLGRSVSVRRMSTRMHDVHCSAFLSR